MANPDKVKFNPGQLPKETPETEDFYSWSGQKVGTAWRKRVQKGWVTLTSPPLGFKSTLEIDSIRVESVALGGPTRLTLHWGESADLTNAQLFTNKRDLGPLSASSRTFVVRGQDLLDVDYMGSHAHETAPRHLFLRFKEEETVNVQRVTVVGKKALFAEEPFGQAREAVDGQVRDTLYITTPGSISYESLVPTGGELLFGLHVLREEGAVRINLGIETADTDRREILDEVLTHKTEWKDYRIRLDPKESGRGRITLDVLSENPGVQNIVFWSNPIISRNPAPSSPPNVILYVVDALRADRLGAEFKGQAISPFLNELSAKGVVFENGYAAASWTKPSVTSLLTSLYPQVHQVGARSYTDVLPASVMTLADHLRRNGYLTANFSANPLSSTLSNLDQGFDDTFTPNSFLNSNPGAKTQKIRSDHLNARMLPWIESNQNERFFIFVHSMDVHSPFAPPVNPFKGSSSKPSKLDLYNAEVHFNDSQIRHLYSTLLELGLAEKTLFVLTADHGESFDEHGRSGHGTAIYEHEVHVPLLLVHPGSLPPKSSSSPVQLIDLLPTILGYCSIPFDSPNEHAIDMLQKGPADPTRRIFLTRFLYPFDIELPAFNEVEHIGMIHEGWKLIVEESTQGREMRYELYNLRKDPLEQRDLSQERIKKVDSLLGELLKFRTAQEKERLAFVREHLRPETDLVTESPTVSQETIDRLRGLGYVE